MVVLILEAGRGRNEDLNEKLRRLALITAEATQSLRVDKALDSILRHLVESLGASHGVVFPLPWTKLRIRPYCFLVLP